MCFGDTFDPGAEDGLEKFLAKRDATEGEDSALELKEDPVSGDGSGFDTVRLRRVRPEEFLAL